MARDARLLARRLIQGWAAPLAGAVLVAGIASYALVRLGSGGGTLQTLPVHVKSKLAPVERRLALEFVHTAVARKNLARAWELAAPELKRGTTRKEWLAGTMRVVPYPVAQANVFVTVVSSYTDTARLDITFLPKPGTKAEPQTFALDLRKVDGRWLASAWTPSATVRPPKGK